MARVAEVEKPSKEVKVNSHGTRIALRDLGMEREPESSFVAQDAGRFNHERDETARKENGNTIAE
jgi:hypothetical protein